MSETELWNLMMDSKARGNTLQQQAFAVTTKPIILRKWNGQDSSNEDNFAKVPLPSGSKVRVVMASRFGDVGITDNLEATSGYFYRTTCVAGELWGRRVEPAGLLTDIELIER